MSYNRHNYDYKDYKERNKSKAQRRKEDIQRILDDDDKDNDSMSSSFGTPKSQSKLSDEKMSEMPPEIFIPTNCNEFKNKFPEN